MKASLRRGSALCALAAFGLVAGCASPNRTANLAGGFDRSNIGLATRAQLAMLANRSSEAIALGERAVAHSPNDAGVRGLLGNIYLAAGRLSSSAAAYRDSLALMPQQAPLVLRLALVEIALGRPGEALTMLEGARPALDAADYGLTLALAGQAGEAVWILDQAARQPGADGRVRQNLALAHALAGDWVQARTIAAQDLSGEQLDQRIAQWTQLAASSSSTYRVATLIGVTPVVDPGMPARLALAPQPGQAPATAASQPAAAPAVATAPVQAQVEVPAAMPAPLPIEQQPVAEAVPVAEPEPSFADPMAQAALPVAAPATRAEPPAQVALGASNSVVQLGAYGSPRRVAAAWDDLSRRFTSLRNYVPTSARFETAAGSVYRLAVRGFNSERDAVALCGQLRRDGGSCFVRSLAGDQPVRLASR